jgi:5-(carboxyamino)imidazole ribonucleotide synthase
LKVGVLGGGQLGRMLGLAGYPLGIRCRFLDPALDASAGQVGELVVGAYDDPRGLDQLAAGTEVVTYEFENVPAAAARHLAARAPTYPPALALETAQDRLAEKRLFQMLGIPTVRFARVDSSADLDSAIDQIGLPALLKTRRLGYDGRGQRLLHDRGEAASAWEALGRVPCILEDLAPFDRELSILAVRGRDGATRTYPLVENHHRDGILRLSRAPAPNGERLQSPAEAYASRVMDHLEYAGVLAIELFQVGDELLANELAPRVHNSGHWTIEGAETSQFENHLRAVLGLPLGSTSTRGHSAMLNLIGELPAVAEALAVDGAHLHLYGKAPRSGRKLGHISLRDDDAARLRERTTALAERLALPL